VTEDVVAMAVTEGLEETVLQEQILHIPGMAEQEDKAETEEGAARQAVHIPELILLTLHTPALD
jgi:hypothetical protein